MAGKTSELYSTTLLKPRIGQFLVWFNQHQPMLSSTVMAFFLAGCAWLGGSLVWLPLEPSAVQTWQVQLANDISSTPASSVNVTAIQQRNIFGDYQAQATDKIVKPVVQSAPETRLALTLVGVSVVDPAVKSLAIIANRNQQMTYGLGEKIEGTRAEVVAVFHDRVVINNAGRNETLMLQDVAYTSGSTSRDSRSAREQRNVDYNQESQNQDNVDETGEPSDALAEIKQKILENPSELFQYVKLSMLKRDGQIAGYRLSPGRSAELFDSVGLQKGDIATSINGVELNEEDAIGKLMPLMQDLTEVNLTVERNGEPYEIYIQF